MKEIINSKITPIKAPSSPESKYTNATRRSEELIAMFPIHEQGKRSSGKCLVYTLAAFVTLLAVWTVFASIVLRVRDPEIQLGSAKPTAMHISTSSNYSYRASPTTTSSLNVTMMARVTLTNPNFGPFDYGNSRVSVLYGVTWVGVGEIGAATVEARGTKEINVMVKVNIGSSNKLLLVSGNFTSDIHSGILKLRSYAKLSGSVHVLKFVNKRKTIVMACIMSLNLTSRSFQHLQC